MERARVPVRLGHGGTDAGFAENVRVQDGRLVADLADIPAAVVAEMQEGHYRTVSIVLEWDRMTSSEVVKEVALLPAGQQGAVVGLQEVPLPADDDDVGLVGGSE